MYDQIGLNVKDVGASVRFYQAALAALGHVLASQDDAGAGLGPPGAPALWLYRAADSASGTHVAFAAPDRAAVDRFHADGLKVAMKYTLKWDGKTQSEAEMSEAKAEEKLDDKLFAKP